MDWQTMVTFSAVFALTNNLINRSFLLWRDWQRKAEIDKMLATLEGIDKRLEVKAAKVKRVK